MNILFFVLSFLFGLLVYGDTRPSDKCVILHSNRVNFAIQCSSSHDNATTLIEVLNSKANGPATSLSIAGVGIDEIPNNLSDLLPNVTNLRLENAPSKEYAMCTNIFKNIQRLELINMNIFEMEFMQPHPNLIELTIVGGEMTKLDKSFGTKLPNLTILSITSDFLGDLNQLIQNLNLPELTSLTVRKTNSKILNVPNLENLPKLKYLYFEDGKLESVPIGNKQTNATISFLSLANNNISIVNESDFEGWTNLRELYLNQNNIKKLSSNSFSKLISLWFLDLRNNSISESYNDTFLGLRSPILVLVGGNPITSGRGE
ncbi:hypothetical protein ACOME3_001490 [Neoechinorhynchus agilis]